MARAWCFGTLLVLSLGCETTPPVTAPVTPTTSASAASSAATTGPKKLFVSERLVDCEGEGPMKCMQTRTTEKEEWTLFYGSIEGFTHDPAFTYELEVDVQPNPNPPAGGSSLRYRLVKIVAKKPAVK